jgi:hypothetical protein
MDFEEIDYNDIFLNTLAAVTFQWWVFVLTIINH